MWLVKPGPQNPILYIYMKNLFTGIRIWGNCNYSEVSYETSNYCMTHYSVSCRLHCKVLPSFAPNVDANEHDSPREQGADELSVFLQVQWDEMQTDGKTITRPKADDLAFSLALSWI